MNETDREKTHEFNKDGRGRFFFLNELGVVVFVLMLVCLEEIIKRVEDFGIFNRLYKLWLQQPGTCFFFFYADLHRALGYDTTRYYSSLWESLQTN